MPKILYSETKRYPKNDHTAETRNSPFFTLSVELQRIKIKGTIKPITRYYLNVDGAKYHYSGDEEPKEYDRYERLLSDSYTNEKAIREAICVFDRIFEDYTSRMNCEKCGKQTEVEVPF